MSAMSKEMSPLPVSLLQLLSTTLVLRHISPLLSVNSLLALSGISEAFRNLIYDSPDTFRYLDLSTVKGASTSFDPIDSGGNLWRSQRMDEAVTEDDFYSGPLRAVFSNLRRRNVLQDVSTLILDGLSVTADLVRELICDEPYIIRFLSIREVKNLNERKLMQVLKYATRPGRPKGSPRLQGLYFFGPIDSEYPKPTLETKSIPPASEGVTSSAGAQLGMQWNHRSQHALSKSLADLDNGWYNASGRMLFRLFFKEWAKEWVDTLRVCEGVITFDAVLCRGPRHDPSIAAVASPSGDSQSGGTLYLHPQLATIALGPTGCEVCRSSPEGAAIPGTSPSGHLPLLTPPPLYVSAVKAAQKPPNTYGSANPLFLARCEACLFDRWCERCKKWWCETCYPPTEATRTGTFTELQKREVLDSEGVPRGGNIKVHLGLCVQGCLVEELYSGAGEGGMWG